VVAPKRRISATDRVASGRSGTRGDHDVGGPQRRDLVEGDGVGAAHERVLAQLGDVPGEVVHERIVVVDEQDHGARAAIMPRALSRVSWYSLSGSDSATTPPPAWKYTVFPATWHVRIATLNSSVPPPVQYPIAPQ